MQVIEAKDVVNLADEKAYSMAAEPTGRHERWTVAQDKMLLRMFLTTWESMPSISSCKGHTPLFMRVFIPSRNQKSY